MSKIKIVFILFLTLISLNITAQEELTEAQKVEFQNRVKQKVDEFQSSLSYIVNNQLKHEIRKEEVTNLLGCPVLCSNFRVKKKLVLLLTL